MKGLANVQRAALIDQAASLELTEEQLAKGIALVVALRVHDIGRHIQQLFEDISKPGADGKGQTSNPDYRQFLRKCLEDLAKLDPVNVTLPRKLLQDHHGLVSRKFLEHFDLLEVLDDSLRTDILEAVEKHNLTSDQEFQSERAKWISERLRDRDILSILEDTHHLSPQGAIAEVMRFFLPYATNLDGGGENNISEEDADGALNGHGVIAEGLKPLSARALNILRGSCCVDGSPLDSEDSLSALSNAINSLKEGKLIQFPIGAPHGSYTLYMLVHLAMIANVSDADLQNSILQLKGVKERVAYVIRTLPTQLNEQFREAWDARYPSSQASTDEA